MINFLLKFVELYKNHTLSITASFAFFILFLLAMQGFDVVDEGWYMTFYQQIFNYPETVEYNFVYYLTGLFGGLCYELFPNGGVLSFRILAICCLVLTFALAYKILIKHITKRIAILSLLMLLFVNDFGYVAFYYNHLSGFLAVLTIVFLYKGLEKNNIILLLIAGALTAINVFSRLPNITLFAFSLVFFVQLFWNKNLNIKYAIKQALVYGLGAVFGFVIMYLILLAFGHLDIMTQSFFAILDKGKNSGSNHNFSRLLIVYLKDYYTIFKALLKLIVAFFILVSVRSILPKNIISKIIWHILGVALFVFICKANAIYTLYAISLLGCFGLLFNKTLSPNLKRLSFLALIIMVFLPLGSDGGINNAGYVCVWLAFPLGIYGIIKSEIFVFSLKIKYLNSILKNNTTISIFGMFFIGFFILKSYKISNEAYFDSGNRYYKTHAINNHLAKGVYTTKERAIIINDVLLALQNYVKKDDYLLAYDKIPMLNFLTETKPYMYNSWVWVYDGALFKKQIERAQLEIEVLPIVVQQKFETIVNFSNPDFNYMSEEKEDDYIYNKNRVKAMNAFLKQNNYAIVWSNNYFNIYKSISNSK